MPVVEVISVQDSLNLMAAKVATEALSIEVEDVRAHR